MRFSKAALLVFGSLALLAGCKGSSSKGGDNAGATPSAAAPETPGAPVPITPPPGATVSATIPDDFPKIVPIYPGAKVLTASKSAGPAGKGVWTLALDTPDEKNHVYTFFRANLSSFKQATDNIVGTTHTGTWENRQYDLTVTVGDAPDKSTSITMAVSGK